MNIVVISPNASGLSALVEQFTALGRRVTAVEGGKSQMAAVADREKPDLMVVDGMCRDLQELALAGQVTARHPQMALVLMCATSSPEFLMQAMRSGVREVLASPAQPDALAELLQRLESRRPGPPSGGPSRAGKVLAFVSCKGGAGATFLAANLGWQLARGAQVLLVDLNLQFGDLLETLHEGKPPATVADLCLSIDRLDRALLAASTVNVTPTLGILAAPEDPARAIDIQPRQVSALLELAATEHDFVIVDLPRALDPLFLAAVDPAFRVYPVLQPQLPALAQAGRMAAGLSALGCPPSKAEFILNRVTRGSAIGLPELRDALGGSVTHAIPNDYRAVSSALDQGLPLAQVDREHPVARALAGLAAGLTPETPASRSLLDRLLRRA